MAEPAQQLKLAAAPADPLRELSDGQRRQIGARLATVQGWRNMCADFVAAGRTRGEATAAYLLAHPEISQRSLHRWAALHDQEGLAGLLDRRGASRQVDPGSTQAIGSSAWKRFLVLYLTMHQRKVSVCYQIVGAEACDRGGDPGWAWPSLRSVQRAAAAIPATQADYYRLGEREWRRQHEPKIRRDFSQYRANQWWVGDCHEWDVFCRLSDTNPRIVRPLLSSFMDLRSRLCVGWHIGLSETQDAVLLAIRMGVVQHGPPQEMCIDNGKPYKACGISGGKVRSTRKVNDEAYVRSVLGGLNITPHFAIPFNPDSKLIEPWHNTIEIQFGSTFESYCGGQKDDRFRTAWKFAQEHPEQCPTVAELTEKFSQWLISYHATPHSGDGMDGLTPAQAMQQCDPIPRAIVPEGALDFLLMRTQAGGKDRPVKINKFGVVYNGIEYGSIDPRMQLLHGQEVVLRIDPVDASYVIVCDMEGRPLFKAVNNRAVFNSLTRENLGEAMRDKAHAKRLAKQVREGGMRPAMEDLTTLAIKAKLRAGQAVQQLVAATGTDDGGTGVPPASRGVTPRRSDFAEAVKRFYRGSIRNLESGIDPGPSSLADVADEVTGDQLSVLGSNAHDRTLTTNDFPLSLADLEDDR